MDIRSDSFLQTASAMSQIANAAFLLTNIGDAQMSITARTFSCGCTTAELTKSTYAPGEGGEFVAKFKVGGREGFRPRPFR